MKTLRECIDTHFESAGLCKLPENALILVGSNPLPVYVAVMALKPKKILLLGTASVSSIMEALQSSLMETLGLSQQDCFCATCQPGKSSDIEHQTNNLLNRLPDSDRDVWISYTAGTKAMAVHSHRTWREHRSHPPSHWAVYISPDGPALWFDGQPPFSLFRNDRYDVPEPAFEEILKIHQIRPYVPSRPYGDDFTCDRRADLANRIHDHIVNTKSVQEYLNLLPPTYLKKLEMEIDGRKIRISGDLNMLEQTNLGDGSYHVTFSLKPWAEAIGMTEIENPNLDTVGAWLTETPLLTASKARKQQRHDTLKWLATEWLETWTARAVTASRQFRDVHQSFDFAIPGVLDAHSEVDVVAMRGHTPFVFSCTIDTTSRLNKHKLFEVRLRANQLGGEHARAAVVCLSETPDVIHKELNLGWAGYGTIQVFGLRDIRSEKEFGGNLQKWIENLEN